MNIFLYVLIGALVFLGLVYAVISIKKKTNSPCGCSCSACSEKADTAEATYTYVVQIDGMSCEHCKARVENAFNELKGCTAEVNLEAKTATVSCAQALTEGVIKETVENLGFTYLSYIEA